MTGKKKKAGFPGPMTLLIIVLLIILLFVVLRIIGIIGGKASIKIPLIG